MAVLLLGLVAVFVWGRGGNERVYETTFPSEVNSAPSSEVSSIIYHEDRKTLVIYFANKPRMDYFDFPKAVYLEFREAADLTEYYHDKVVGTYKPY